MDAEFDSRRHLPRPSTTHMLVAAAASVVDAATSPRSAVIDGRRCAFDGEALGLFIDTRRRRHDRPGAAGDGDDARLQRRHNSACLEACRDE